MPLIFGAMSHFIPVLTRTRTPPPDCSAFPCWHWPAARWSWLHSVCPTSLCGDNMRAHCWQLIAASALLVWSRRRRAGMLGRPHPCLAWYETALACLVLALVAILASAFWPQQAMALRRLHLHLNTLGFVGLTALGTLARVVADRHQPTRSAKSAQRMHRDLPWAIAGTLLIAVGAAWIGPARRDRRRHLGRPAAADGRGLAVAIPHRNLRAAWRCTAARHRGGRPRLQRGCRCHEPASRNGCIPVTPPRHGLSSPDSCCRWCPERPASCCRYGCAQAFRALGTHACATCWDAMPASVPCCSDRGHGGRNGA